eukprot:CAMPEP_0118859652 /NCGR_PEP_ID=MMETSP1163-20130328/5809_1 /TAXON_ID=124430 /ORGANISM="Phaeomonas parva, Strain CCMP2877" /LENGTH=1781 /DNA_ID=CAMNT_0006793275 /DNA_START=180 /DNA_END=5525 /DNA_ORIENTATION=-
MEPGVRVWVRDPDGLEAWLPGIVHSKLELPGSSGSDGLQDVQVELDDDDHYGQKLSFPVALGHSEADDIKLRNKEEDDLTEDLIDLPFLHEPAILHTLLVRFQAGSIYTFTGPILIAVNPFQRLPLYTDQILQEYYNAGLMKSQGMADLSGKVRPHVYAIADNAYRDMSAGLHKRRGRNHKTNQAVLISGESGAGKTESTKIVMRYLTVVGNSTGSTEFEEGSVMDRVLQSNPILEAFGNARTNRNDNSSRFGKYIELLFNRRGNLVGAMIETYLLEKVRLASQLTGERNFHIFYQLTSKRNEAIIEKFGGVTREELGLTRPQEYRFINQGGIYTLRGVDDADELKATQHAMDVLRFSPEEQADIVRLVAGLLHLGQVTFKTLQALEGDGADLDDSAEAQHAMETACRLLGVEQATLLDALTKRTIETRGEKFTRTLTAAQAVDACAAVVKAIYLSMFEWIVDKVNQSIQCPPEDFKASIGVLDIFGFECFERNSFEQLCINYTNETLQQHFNSYVFKLEQAEYEREGIQWSFIEFPDNQDCLDLIEGRPNGLFATLDDECRMGQRGNDNNFVNRLYKQYVPTTQDTHVRFGASTTERRDFQFTVKHYAGVVVYDSDGFLVKNKDELPPEAAALFVSSTSELMRDSHELYQRNSERRMSMAQQSGGGKSGGGGRRQSMANKRAPTISFQFKNQLKALMTKVNGCSPHYIRCIKPNDVHSPDVFAKMRTVDQLRYGGVLEAVRVARSGFPVRLPHTEFYTQYRCLLNAEQGQNMPVVTAPGKEQELCNELVDAVYAEMRAEVDAYDLRCRESEGGDDPHKLHRLANAKGIGSLMGNTPTFIFDREEVQLGKSKVFMRKLAFEIMEAARSRRLGAWARRIQSSFRCWRLARVLNAQRKIALNTQRFYRGAKARFIVQGMREERAAIRLQAYFKFVLARCSYLRLLYAVEMAQARWRARKARIAYLKLRYEASALTVQRVFRGFRARGNERKLRRCIVAIQCRCRRMIAKRLLKELRIEAKSVGKLQQNNEALKKEIEDLKAAAAAAAALERERVAAEAMADVETLREALERATQELREEKEKNAKAEEENKRQSEDLTVARQELEDVTNMLQQEQMRNAKLQDDYEMACEAAERSALAATQVAQAAAKLGPSAPSEDLLARARKNSEASMSRMNSEASMSRMNSEASEVSLEAPKALPASLRRARAMERGEPRSTSRDLDDQPVDVKAPKDLPSSLRTRSSLGNTAPTPMSGLAEEAENDLDLPAPMADGSEAPPQRTPLATRKFSRMNSADGGDEEDGNAVPGSRTDRLNAAVKPRRASSTGAGDINAMDRPETDGTRPSLLSMIAHKLNLSQVEGTWEEGNEEGEGGRIEGLTLDTVSESPGGDGAIPVNDEVGVRIRRLYSYESHLQEFQERLRKGIEVRVWDEGAGRQGVLCSMMLKENDNVPRLSWEHSISWRRTIFGQRTAIPDLPFFELEHIWTGHSELYGLAKKDESRYITIVASPTPTTPARSVVIMCYNRTQRNGLLQGLRKLIADIEVLSSGNVNQDLATISPSQMDVNENSLTALLFGGPQTPGGLDVDTPQSQCSKPPLPSPAASVGGGAAVKENQRPSVKSSARSAQDRAKAHATTITAQQGASGSFQRFSLSDLSPRNGQLPKAQEGSEDIMVKLTDVQRTITAERLNYEKLMIQMLENQNDLNDKEDEIGNLKRSLEDMRSLLTSRDDAIRNDSQVRMRLGKRIEDLENDQSILQEENEKLILEVHDLRKIKEQLDQYKRQLASMSY